MKKVKKKFIASLKGNKPIGQRFILTGKTIVPGKAVGKVVHYQDILSSEVEVRDLRKGQVSREVKRARAAFQRVERNLEEDKKKRGSNE